MTSDTDRPPATSRILACALAAMALVGGCRAGQPATQPPSAYVEPVSSPSIRWRRVHHETFDAAFANPIRTSTSTRGTAEFDDLDLYLPDEP